MQRQGWLLTSRHMERGVAALEIQRHRPSNFRHLPLLVPDVLPLSLARPTARASQRCWQNFAPSPWPGRRIAVSRWC